MLDKALEALKTYDWGQDAKALKPIEDAINETHGNETERAKIEEQLVAALGSDYSFDARQMVCRYLRTCGTAASVPALAKLLADEKLSHMARYALERIPAPEAGAALRDSLGNVGGALKIGVIASLGVRQEDANVEVLAQALGDSDPAISKAGAQALGATRTAAAAKALADGKASAEAQAAVADAKLACAESILAGGNNKEALAIYKSLVSADLPKQFKLAATRGVLACAKSN